MAVILLVQYSRNDIAFERGQFRVRGDTVDIRTANTEDGVRVEFFGDEIERIQRFDPLTGDTIETLSATTAAQSAFVVTTDGTGNAVTAVAVNGVTVELTLTTTVKNDQTVTVAYTDPSNGNDANYLYTSAEATNAR